MKKLGLVIIVFLISHSTFSKDVVLSCRDYYYEVCLNETTIQEFDKYLMLHKNNKDVSVKGYQSVRWFLWAEFYVNPVKKWKYFSKGKDALEQLISYHSDNTELRFLRLTIQDNVPWFLGYYKNIKEDKAFISGELNKIVDEDLRKRIVSYLYYDRIAKIK